MDKYYEKDLTSIEKKKLKKRSFFVVCIKLHGTGKINKSQAETLGIHAETPTSKNYILKSYLQYLLLLPYSALCIGGIKTHTHTSYHKLTLP